MDEPTLQQLRAAIAAAASGGPHQRAALEHLDLFRRAPTSASSGAPVDVLEYAHALLQSSAAAEAECAALLRECGWPPPADPRAREAAERTRLAQVRSSTMMCVAYGYASRGSAARNGHSGMSTTKQTPNNDPIGAGWRVEII